MDKQIIKIQRIITTEMINFANGKYRKDCR